MGILNGNPKDEPLHYGEIYDVWQFSMLAKGSISTNRAMQNHAGDKDLKKILATMIEQAELESSECDTILTHNGITPSPSLPQRPEVKLEAIPAGARFSDQEIASLIAAGNSLGLIACSQVMAKSIREDVSALFAKYHLAKAETGKNVLHLLKEKGWLVPPPLQMKRPDLVQA